MASRVKKIFHRKRDEQSEEPQQPTRAPATATSDPAMRTSLYESTTAGALPQTGDHPIKGNDSSVILQAGRKSSVRSLRSRRSSSRGSQYNTPYRAPTPTQYDGSRAVPRAAPQPSYAASPPSYDPHQNPTVPTNGQHDRQKRWSRPPLPQEFANLSLDDSQSPMTTVTQTVTTTRTGHQGQFANRATPKNQSVTNHNDISNTRTRHTDPPIDEPYANSSGVQRDGYDTPVNAYARPVNQSHGQQYSTPKPHRDNAPPNSRPDVYDTPTGQGDYDAGPTRHNSIPRKQVGASAQGSFPSPESSTLRTSQIGHSRQQSASKALPTTPVSSGKGYEARRPEAASQPASILDRSRPITRGPAQPHDAQDVVKRAKSDTYDTEVIEKVAPAVVHDNITNDVHHIREEVITREVHNHDVFHRILPVVDVEVLPPRHFLPVEGGGLVEVSAAEVPGRGQNWVIAETASKIPSDQAAPQGVRRFTAREFPGKEGDAVKYIAPEGHEKTEQTWVHYPELEQGARLTGQSWPMVFGDDTGGKDALDNSIPKSTKRKSPKKGSASAAHRVGGIGNPS